MLGEFNAVVRMGVSYMYDGSFVLCIVFIYLYFNAVDL